MVLAWALAAELERIGGLDQTFIEQHVLGAEAYLERARQMSLEEAARVCGVDASQIHQLAELYRTISPAVICPGNGPERNQNGGSGLRAVFALPALAGKFGVLGGGLLQGASASFPKTLAPSAGRGVRTTGCPHPEHRHHRPRSPRSTPQVHPSKGLFIYNHNAVIVHPDQNTMRRGLLRRDLFTVVCDIVKTDTVLFADVVLPACSHFEYPDLYPAYGQHFLQRAEPVIPPVGESLPNTEIFRRLAKRFSFTEPAFQASDAALMDDALAQDDPRLHGLKPSTLPLDQALPMQFNGSDAMLFKTTFPKTPSGKVELQSAYLEKPMARHCQPSGRLNHAIALTLISPGSDKRTTSTFGGLRYSDEVWLDMHPQDAAARRLIDGTMVRVWNDQGEVHLRLRCTEDVPTWRCLFAEGRLVPN